MNAAQCHHCGQPFAPSYAQPPQSHYPQANPNWQGYGPQADSNRLLVTLLLWFFVGHFGAHRFYLGHTNTAVVMLTLEIVGIITACLLVGWFLIAAVAIWWIIDLIQILTGNLRPIDGSRLV